MLLNRKLTKMAAAIGIITVIAAFICWIVHELRHEPAIDERVFRELICHTLIADDGTPNEDLK